MQNASDALCHQSNLNGFVASTATTKAAHTVRMNRSKKTGTGDLYHRDLRNFRQEGSELTQTSRECCFHRNSLKTHGVFLFTRRSNARQDTTNQNRALARKPRYGLLFILMNRYSEGAN